MIIHSRLQGAVLNLLLFFPPFHQLFLSGRMKGRVVFRERCCYAMFYRNKRREEALMLYVISVISLIHCSIKSMEIILPYFQGAWEFRVSLNHYQLLLLDLTLKTSAVAISQ